MEIVNAYMMMYSIFRLKTCNKDQINNNQIACNGANNFRC